MKSWKRLKNENNFAPRKEIKNDLMITNMMGLYVEE